MAQIILRHRNTILSENRDKLKSNLAALELFFADYADLFAWQKPDGGCIAYPRYIGRGSIEDLCANLVRERGVLLLPASIYTSELLPTPAQHFRIGFGRDNIDRGLAEFRIFIEQNKQQLYWAYILVGIRQELLDYIEYQSCLSKGYICLRVRIVGPWYH